ncbi:TAXI family TRAP transporter solute-binding subunit [Actinomadura flavalba]|uniref:TAXI family TRAP transporter solute-binding subunit n=1 Tax=Actinomadura flavalba TaxID=1120938 RepID=UPI00039C9180|nr:TAXI family TRAP transporter solute-binding subunit [Actinomadura flavalba]
MRAVDVRILCPGQNWMNIGSLIANGMGGYGSPLPDGSTIAAVTGTPPAALGMDGPRLVARGRYHFGITTPNWALALACAGKGPYTEPLPLRAVAAFPHDDRLALAVRAETGITSLSDIAARRLPLKISMPTREMGHPARWVMDEILACHGFSQEDLESWGGEVLRDRPRSQNSPDAVPADPSFDAVFDEAIMTHRWRKLTTQYDLRFLPLEEHVLAHCAALGMPAGVLEKGRLRGLDRDVPTLDFSGWILYCAADLPDELAHLAVRAIDEQRETISARFTGPTRAMTAPVDLRATGRDLPVPLHPGAAAYYREQGHLDDTAVIEED